MADSPRTPSSTPLIGIVAVLIAIGVVIVGFYHFVIDTSDHHLQVYCPSQQVVPPGDNGLEVAIKRAAEETGAQPKNIVSAIAATNPDIGPNRTVAACFDGDKEYVSSLNGTLVPK